MKTQFVSLVAAVGLMAGCSSGKQVAQAGDTASNSKTAVSATPKVIVYKTRKDYTRNVPVTLSADRKQIVAYPSTQDVKIGNRYTYPTRLANGWLLDNRGISRNVAFLSYTYEEYAALPSTPRASELMDKIIDNDPLTDYRVMGSRYDYQDLIQELNEKLK